jgi:hypothetical protein
MVHPVRPSSCACGVPPPAVWPSTCGVPPLVGGPPCPGGFPTSSQFPSPPLYPPLDGTNNGASQVASVARSLVFGGCSRGMVTEIGR